MTAKIFDGKHYVPMVTKTLELSALNLQRNSGDGDTIVAVDAYNRLVAERNKLNEFVKFLEENWVNDPDADFDEACKLADFTDLTGDCSELEVTIYRPETYHEELMRVGEANGVSLYDLNRIANELGYRLVPNR